MKKRSEETQTLRAGCSKADPKNFAHRRRPPRGRGAAKINNQLELVTIPFFTYEPSLVSIDERTSYRGNRPTHKHTPAQTGLIQCPICKKNTGVADRREGRGAAGTNM